MCGTDTSTLQRNGMRPARTPHSSLKMSTLNVVNTHEIVVLRLGSRLEHVNAACRTHVRLRGEDQVRCARLVRILRSTAHLKLTVFVCLFGFLYAMKELQLCRRAAWRNEKRSSKGRAASLLV